MTLENMKRRLNYHGGPKTQNRMIKDKSKSLQTAIKESYQSAIFQKYPLTENGDQVEGLFNRVTENLDYDTKMISVDFSSGYQTGDIVNWQNTNSLWIIYQWDRTELAYFRGLARRCGHITQWIDKDREKQEALLSVIGPNEISMTTAGGDIPREMPSDTIIAMAQDTPVNRAFFTRYQIFLINGTPYRVERVNYSIPGVLQLGAKEHYANKVEDDIENNVRNVWNVQPVIEKTLEPQLISGPNSIKPYLEYEYSAKAPGEWKILDQSRSRLPISLIKKDDGASVIIRWMDTISGSFTLEYRNETEVSQLYIVAQSIM